MTLAYVFDTMKELKERNAMEAIISIIIWAFAVMLMFSLASMIVSIFFGVIAGAFSLVAGLFSAVYHFMLRGLGRE